MAGRKSNATIIGPNAYLPIERFTISHSMEWVRGAKREIRDDDGKLLNSERDFRTGIGGTYTKEQAESIRSDMEKQGIKNIKLRKLNWDLPSKCPRCKNNGNPNIYLHKEPYSQKHVSQGINKDFLRLVYNHSHTNPKMCVVGTVILDSPIPRIELSSKLQINSLSHARRVGVYPFKKSIN